MKSPLFIVILSFCIALSIGACKPFTLGEGNGDSDSKGGSEDSTQQEEQPASQTLLDNDLSATDDLKLSQLTIGDSSNKNEALLNQRFGRFELRLTDAPVDVVDKVYVTIKGVELHHSGLGVITFQAIDSQKIDLLSLQGTKSISLLDSIDLPIGRYTWIRLMLETDEESDMFVLANDKQYPLILAEGATASLLIPSNIEISESTDYSFTIDFDLRKSLLTFYQSPRKDAPQHTYSSARKGEHDEYDSKDEIKHFVLKPVLRLVDNNSAGHILGQVDETLLASSDCEDADVYLFDGTNIEPTDMVRLGQSIHGPSMSSPVKYDDGQYRFEFGFLAFGAYTIALTCEAEEDELGSVDNIAFEKTQNIVVDSILKKVTLM